MSARTWSAATACAAALTLGLTPTAAHAVPSDTPAGTGGGCPANGQAVSGSAQAAGPFGADVVSLNAPIAPLVAVFFTTICADPS